VADIALMHIGELADKAGVSTRTLRFYEQQGLLDPFLRTEKGVRIYSADQVRKLKLIKLFKTLGLNLKQIKTCLAINQKDATGSEVAEQVRELAATHAIRLAAQIQAFERAKEELERASRVFESCRQCQLKSSVRQCPCEILTERYEQFPVMMELFR
jgi:DNA-binding transcriptional MerR regulator